ncbi:MAG: hypothetical protein LUC43_08885 [Burkholderiales bacterium]|nr:hypothetical protein [Burkholderiales bacterium]
MRSFIHPDKLEALIANVEYYGSKNLQEFSQEETPSCAMAFFDNEFEKEWVCIPEDQELLEFPDYFEQNAETVKNYPVLCRALSGDDSKISVILSPECFEVDMLFSEKVTIQ